MNDRSVFRFGMIDENTMRAERPHSEWLMISQIGAQLEYKS